MKLNFKTWLALCVVCVACQPKSFTEQEARNILHERNEKLAQLFKAGDAKAVALIYCENAKLCPNGTDFFVGRSAIQDFWAKDMAASKLIDMSTETLTVDVDTNVIYETGRTTGKTLYGDSTITFQVKFANVWRKQPNGEYLLDVDIWNAVQ